MQHALPQTQHIAAHTLQMSITLETSSGAWHCVCQQVRWHPFCVDSVCLHPA